MSKREYRRFTAEQKIEILTERFIEELDALLNVPGMANVWVQPIRNRTDMLATGIKSPVGIKISGGDLATLEKLGQGIEHVVRSVPGASSVIADRVTGGRYIDVKIDRLAAARYGLSIEDVQQLIAFGIGGENIGQIIDGRARFPINVRFPRELRDSPRDLAALPIVTPSGATVPLGSVADVSIVDGPPMIKSENARLSLWVYVDIRDRDLGGFVAEAQEAVGPGSSDAGRVLTRPVGSVRVSRARDRAAEMGRAGDARHHLPVVVPDLSKDGSGVAHPRHVAIRAGWRRLVDVPAGTQYVRRERGRHDRSGGPCSGVWRSHACFI